MTLASTAGGIVFVLLALAAVVAVPIVLKTVGLGNMADLLLRLLRWPVMLVALAALLACIYRFGPSREKASWSWVSWSSGFAAVAWVLGLIAFSYYVSHLGSYNKIYGSLGAAVGFLTWICLSATVVLTGAEVNAGWNTRPPGTPRPVRTRRLARAERPKPTRLPRHNASPSKATRHNRAAAKRQTHVHLLRPDGCSSGQGQAKGELWL